MNIAFIPVRGGSKSIPLKNIKELCGHPLVWWTANSANNAKCIDKVVIATDSDKIKEVVLSFNLDKVEVYDRDPVNAQDTSSTESVMIEYIQKSGLKNNDNFFLIQATSPLLKSEHIDGMYQKFLEDRVDSMFTAVREKQFHWIETTSLTPRPLRERVDEVRVRGSQVTNEVKPVNYDYRNRPRRQDFEGLLAENGACYINTVGNIIKDNCRLSGKIGFYELPAETAYEIDEESDWLIIESILKFK